jgi:hypothetical protein
MTHLNKIALVTLFLGISNNLFAQTEMVQAIENEQTYKDTSIVPAKRLKQQEEFLAKKTAFPAKPRNQWEIGINIGQANISGDVRTKNLFNAQKGALPLGFGATIRKAWGYVISTRLQYIHATTNGLGIEESPRHWGHNSNPWNTVANGAYKLKPVYDNYKTTMNELTLQAMFSLNNFKFHNSISKTSYYAFIGLGGLGYNTMINALNGSNGVYDFNAVNQNLPSTTRDAWDNRKEIDNRLKDLLDNSFETQAEVSSSRGRFGKKGTFRGIATFGAGMQYRLSKRTTLQIEDKATWTGDDLLDGVQWQGPARDIVTGNAVSGSMTRDMDTWNYFSVGLNFNLGSKSSSPLWWMNPLSAVYNESMAKNAPSKCDNDSDGDGVSDCFDRCPNTPGGVTTDSHGCPFDTDGDGVEDYKDKQLITPTECQPSNKDGVGSCPDPACCKNKIIIEPGCGNIPTSAIKFDKNSIKLNGVANANLAALAVAMRNSPNCKTVIIGNGSGSKMEQQRSWDRVNAIINYMVDNQSIDRERFIFQYGNSGDIDLVEYRSANNEESGPSNTPPPFPNLRNK